MRKLTLTLSAAALALAGGATVAYSQDGRHGPDADGDGAVTRAEASAHAAQMFARLDVNSDGAINAADREARKAERFAKLDADGNGEVTQAEMKAAHEARRARMQERRADRAEKRADRAAEHFARLDTDNSGGISQAEMDAAREKRGEMRQARKGGDGEMRQGKRGHAMRGGPKGRMGGGMRMMHGMLMRADADGDKSVTRAEFDAAAASHFAEVDTDNNGSITAEERKAARETMKAKWQAKREERRANRAAQ